jgi:hypothetical protein
MPMKFLYSLIVLSTLCCSLSADVPILPAEDAQQLIVNNRILTKVNGKTISVIDVLKKMDVFLTRAYPQLANSKTARFQFYMTSWQSTLSQMIESELIQADAEAIDLKVGDGDVREALQGRFGPNVMANLEKIKISYEEAWQMIHSELVVQRMNWYRVNSKAILSVNPQDIKAAYKEYCEKNPAYENWKYQVLSIRSKDKKISEELVQKAYHLLTNEKEDIAIVEEVLKNDERVDASTSVSLSPMYDVTDKEISESHKSVLISLELESYSLPILQVSRFDNSAVYRIFLLKQHTKTPVIPFEKIADKLHDQLVEKAIVKETDLYLSKLKDRFNFSEKYLQESIPADFEPFTLR